MEPLSLIIGLEDRFRGSALEAQLNQQGLQPNRVSGVLVHELPEPSDAYADQGTANVLLRRNLTLGEIGCALAHRNAYKALLSDSASHALVFEDDARIVSLLPFEEIRRLLASPKPRIVLFDWNPGWTIISGNETSKGSSLYRAMFAPIDARGYALNRPAASLLMQDGARINYVADWPAQVAGMIEFYVSYPRPVRADEAVKSTLEGERQNQGVVQAEPRHKKAIRMVETATHIQWLKQRQAYGSYPAYIRHEILRLPAYALARKLDWRLDPSDRSSPFTLRPRWSRKS